MINGKIDDEPVVLSWPCSSATRGRVAQGKIRILVILVFSCTYIICLLEMEIKEFREKRYIHS